MIRDKLIERGVGAESDFRWRSHEITRIEGLSDAVFAFAVTLLVVSLEVPKTFDELWQTMHGFGAFAISFAMLLQLWYAQYLFFRRYALQDAITVTLNATLLFLVVFYVYPLKFLFTFLLTIWTRGSTSVRLSDGTIHEMIRQDQLSALMIVYGLGMVAVFTVLAVLYFHARRKRALLELTPVEEFDTMTSAYQNLANAAVGVISVLMVVAGGLRMVAVAGFAYFLIPIAQTFLGMSRGRLRRRFIASLTSADSFTSRAAPEDSASGQ